MAGIVNSCRAMWNGMGAEAQKSVKACAGGLCTLVATRALLLAKATQLSNLSIAIGGIGSLSSYHYMPNLGVKVCSAAGAMIAGAVDQIDPLAAVASLAAIPLPAVKGASTAILSSGMFALSLSGSCLLLHKTGLPNAALLPGLVMGMLGSSAVTMATTAGLLWLSPETVGGVILAAELARRIYSFENVPVEEIPDPVLVLAPPGGADFGHEGYVPPVFGAGALGEQQDNLEAEGVLDRRLGLADMEFEGL